jgi:hypothetical protein
VQLFRVVGRHRPTGPQECSCGHATLAHEHYRKGSDCALCECTRYHGVPAQPRDELESRRERARLAA